MGGGDLVEGSFGVGGNLGEGSFGEGGNPGEGIEGDARPRALLHTHMPRVGMSVTKKLHRSIDP